jgi:hypothetical protein
MNIVFALVVGVTVGAAAGAYIGICWYEAIQGNPRDNPRSRRR